MAEMGLVERALAFAAQHHAGQTRKGSRLPCILHPCEVAVTVSSMTGDLEVIAAAVLHDVLEDTSAEKEELFALFGARVTSLVCAESEDKRVGTPKSETWHLRKSETLERLEHEGLDVQMIALSDKLSNLRAIKRDLKLLGQEHWQHFNQTDASEHGWYYRTLAQRLKALAAYPAYAEYCALVEDVFG